MDEQNEFFTIGQIEGFEHLRDERFEYIYLRLSQLGDSLMEEFNMLFDHLYGLQDVSPAENKDEIISLFRIYSDQYSYFVDYFNELVASKVDFKGVKMDHFMTQVRNLRRFDDDRTNIQYLMMQQTGIMVQTTKFLYQLYMSLVDRNQPVFKYMQDGAKHLRYTNQRLFGKMYSAMRMKNILNLGEAIVRGTFGGNTLYPDWCLKNNDAGRGVAVADYPYTFNATHKKDVQIRPVTVKGDLGGIYKTSDCSIYLGQGEQTALFTIVNDHFPRVILSFAGTEFKLTKRGVHNVVSDGAQILFGPETTYLAAVGLLLDVRKQFSGHIYVVGHSLGGGLMQYAVTAVGDGKVQGVGYNSAGLSDYSIQSLTYARKRNAESRIRHICADTDFVSPIGNQIGRVFHIDTGKKYSHGLDDLNMAINGELISCYV